MFVLLASLCLLPWTRTEALTQTTVSAALERPGIAQKHAVIFVVRRGWHVDVGFAVKDLDPGLVPVAKRFPGVEYLLFGFGDRRYLLSRHHGPPVLLAALWPGPALVLVTALSAPPEAAFDKSSVVRLEVPADDFRRAQEFVVRELSDAETPLAEGPYVGSLFYAARERYSGLRTCNTWAAEDLAAAGLKLPHERILFAGQLWRRVRRAASGQGANARSPLPPLGAQSQLPLQ